MGNKYSGLNGDSEALKLLYKCNDEQFQSLRQKLSNQAELDFEPFQMLSMVIEKQNNLLGKIPRNNFNRVSKFLEIINNDLKQMSQNNQPYMSEDDRLEAEFKREQAEREDKFYNSQKMRRKKYVRDINEFNKSSIDGKKLFKLSENFTMDELKMAYRNLSRRFHPDRPDGNTEKFQLITKAYMSLMEELKLKEDDKPFNVLKQESESFIQTQNANPRQNIKMKSGRFDPKLFNKIYEENRLHDVSDDGYSGWITSTKLEEREIEKPKVFSENFNINVFNNIFEQQVKNTHELVEFKEPDAQNFDNFSNTSGLLGVDRIGNYGGGGFSDFREAHTTSRLVDHRYKQQLKPRVKTLDELKAERSNINKLTAEELKEIELRKKQNEQSDLDRIYNLQKNDERYNEHYNKLNQRMIDTNLLQRK